MLYPEHYPTLEFLRQRNRDIDTIPEEAVDAYYESLTKHIAAVQDVGNQLGLSEWQLERHDLSKFSHAEFNGYALHFHGGGAPAKFARAWLNHIHSNPHHWQFYIFPDGFKLQDADLENSTLEMPENYALEMLADWSGASFAYTGSFDMTDWLKKNIPRISVHSKTADFLRSALHRMGYDDVMDNHHFRSEVVFASNNI